MAWAHVFDGPHGAPICSDGFKFIATWAPVRENWYAYLLQDGLVECPFCTRWLELLMQVRPPDEPVDWPFLANEDPLPL